MRHAAHPRTLCVRGSAQVARRILHGQVDGLARLLPLEVGAAVLLPNLPLTCQRHPGRRAVWR
eukprot:681502-Alexandrium_andersonii.AAC.1